MKKILWSITKSILIIIGKLFLLFAWGVCEFLSVVFTALAKWLKGKVSAKS